MKIKFQLITFWTMAILLGLSSCQSSGGNQTGSEYMPDMAHSVAYESQTFGYYYNNRWGTKEELHAMVQPRIPVSGTISRGHINASPDYVPYYYGNSEEERTRATNEITTNPYPITEKGLETGKRLYNIQCGICHGEKGDGNGYLVRDDGGKYPVQPANFMLDEFVNSSEGRYYHAIMHGKNLMGAYNDKLSYEERWQVIHYIRSLQASHTKTEYNASVNTLNSSSTPWASWKKEEPVAEPAEVTADVPSPVNEGE
jgi:mono/diheme cytochrome c family protein